MISTALAIQDATRDAVHDESVMDMASMIYHSRHNINEDEFIRMMYAYSAHLSALTATLVTSVCLTETQMDEMMNTIKEIEAMGKDVE